LKTKMSESTTGPPPAAAAPPAAADPAVLDALQPGMTVIELVSLPGPAGVPAAHRVGATGKVIVVAGRPDLLDGCRAEADRLSLRQVEFLLGSCESLPVAGEVADAVLCGWETDPSWRKDRVLREAFRVLRPGGMLAVSEVVLVAALPAGMGGQPAGRPSPLSRALLGALPLEEFLELVRAAGFKQPLVRSLEGYPLEQLGHSLAIARVAALKVETCC
jgi:arsenite methyltransferase